MFTNVPASQIPLAGPFLVTAFAIVLAGAILAVTFFMGASSLEHCVPSNNYLTPHCNQTQNVLTLNLSLSLVILLAICGPMLTYYATIGLRHAQANNPERQTNSVAREKLS